MDILRYARGQVWMAYDTNNYIPHNETDSKYHNSVQAGKRPVLIISSDEGNATNTTVICLKLTSKIKTKSINVSIENECGETNTVLCNQIATISKSDLISYRYTIKEDKMAEIEHAYMQSTGIHSIASDIDKYMNRIENIVAKLKYTKDKQIRDASSDTDAVKVLLEKMSESYQYIKSYFEASKLNITNNLDSMSKWFYDKEVCDTLSNNVESTNSDNMVNNVSSDNDTKIIKVARKAPGYWTLQRMEEFLQDTTTLSKEEIQNKWDVTRKDIPKRAYLCRKALKNRKDI